MILDPCAILALRAGRIVAFGLRERQLQPFREVVAPAAKIRVEAACPLLYSDRHIVTLERDVPIDQVEPGLPFVELHFEIERVPHVVGVEVRLPIPEESDCTVLVFCDAVTGVPSPARRAISAAPARASIIGK